MADFAKKADLLFADTGAIRGVYQFLPSHEGRSEGRNGNIRSDQTLSSARTEQILAAISENPYITICSLAKELDIPRSAVERILKSLRESGVIRHEGPTKKGRWVVL